MKVKMKLYSTNNPSTFVTLKEALFNGLPPDNGLYMPFDIPVLNSSFFRNIGSMSLNEIGYEVSRALIGEEISAADLREIVKAAITFPAPVVELENGLYVQELFHGPSLAFKDFGARFMAQLMSYYNKYEEKELVILVATSGDTGGAVAAGFHNTPGIKVVVLYPSGKVSPLQEKQLTTFGGNISAVEVDGTFDDCQALVKRAFLDVEIRGLMRLSSANSINIARLIPQSFYYFEGFRQVKLKGKERVVYCVPSGNFGNLTAGLIAKRMGLPVEYFIAATNANDIVPEYLDTGLYAARPSLATLSNAMDVGNPSNFVRMLDLYGSTWNKMRQDIVGQSVTDEETETAMKQAEKKYGYVFDPHGAVGYHAALNAREFDSPKNPIIILETAHPAKFLSDAERILGKSIFIPERLSILANKEKKAYFIKPDFSLFKDWLLDNYMR
jgi:threonine synthase